MAIFSVERTITPCSKRWWIYNGLHCRGLLLVPSSQKLRRTTTAPAICLRSASRSSCLGMGSYGSKVGDGKDETRGRVYIDSIVLGVLRNRGASWHIAFAFSSKRTSVGGRSFAVHGHCPLNQRYWW